MKTIITLLSAFLCFFATSQAQVEREDSATFRKYAMQDIQPCADISTLQEIFTYWVKQDNGEKENESLDKLWSIRIRDSYTPGVVSSGSHLSSLYNQGEKANASYNRALIRLHEEYESKEKNADSIAQEKQNLIESLTAMDTLLHNKPLFFQVIHTRYKGNIASYVDDLYANSFMTSPKRFKQMMRKTRPKRLIKDLRVNYSLSMALYEVWLMQQNQEETSESVQ